MDARADGPEQGGARAIALFLADQLAPSPSPNPSLGLGAGAAATQGARALQTPDMCSASDPSEFPFPGPSSSPAPALLALLPPERVPNDLHAPAVHPRASRQIAAVAHRARVATHRRTLSTSSHVSSVSGRSLLCGDDCPCRVAESEAHSNLRLAAGACLPRPRLGGARG